MSKIIDCTTFYNENLLINTRFEILKDVVDHFIICESKFDHSGNPKTINFELLNNNFSKKIKHIVIDKNFPQPIIPWKNEEIQREILMNHLSDYDDEDYIMYSDADEIPNPSILRNIMLNKKFGIFFQKNYIYKINIFNQHETPWEGTRICKKKDLKSIFHLRKKIASRNLKKAFWKFYIEKNIEILLDGGWHFNNLYNLETISQKLKVFPHKEYSMAYFSDVKKIKKRINNLEDLFDRGHKYQKVLLDKSFPKYILENKELFKDFIL